MTDEFDRVFGARRPNYTERVAPPASASTSPDGEETSVGSTPYKSFGYFAVGGKIGETCLVQRWIENTETPEGIEFQYRFLMQVGFVGETQVKLSLPDCIVVIEGKGLVELRKMLSRRRATFICQYSPLVWPDAPPKGEPIIERIQIARPETLTVPKGSG